MSPNIKEMFAHFFEALRSLMVQMASYLEPASSTCQFVLVSWPGSETL